MMRQSALVGSTTTCKSEHYRLSGGDVLRLPRTCSGIHVESGYVRITRDGEDILLRRGEQFHFAPGHDHPVVTTLHHSSAVTVMLPKKRKADMNRVISQENTR